jgi:hypothetical protein
LVVKLPGCRRVSLLPILGRKLRWSTKPDLALRPHDFSVCCFHVFAVRSVSHFRFADLSNTATLIPRKHNLPSRLQRFPRRQCALNVPRKQALVKANHSTRKVCQRQFKFVPPDPRLRHAEHLRCLRDSKDARVRRRCIDCGIRASDMNALHGKRSPLGNKAARLPPGFISAFELGRTPEGSFRRTFRSNRAAVNEARSAVRCSFPRSWGASHFLIVTSQVCWVVARALIRGPRLDCLNTARVRVRF